MNPRTVRMGFWGLGLVFLFGSLSVGVPLSAAPQEMSLKDWVKFWEKRPPFTTEDKSADLTFNFDCPFVKMQLNGKRPINTLLDTGGARLYIKPSVAQELGLAIPHKGTVRADSVKIGTLELKNIHFTSEWPSRFNMANIEAVLGSSILWEFATTFDFSDRKVIFGARAKVSPASDEEDQKRLSEMEKVWKEAGGHRVKMTTSLKEPQPYGEFDVGGKRHKFGVDTGYTTNVMRSETAKKLSLKVSGRSVTIESLKAGEYTVSTLTFGYNTDPNVPDILGANFMKRFKRVTFDYVNKDIVFYPSGGSSK